MIIAHRVTGTKLQMSHPRVLHMNALFFDPVPFSVNS